MELVESYRGFEIRRTTPGHLIVVDPLDAPADRAGLVTLLAGSDALDALFFPTVAAARATIDTFIANGLVRPGF